MDGQISLFIIQPQLRKEEIIMPKKLGRSFLHIFSMVVMCILLTGIGYATDNPLPAEYPDEWGVIFGQAKPLKEVEFPSIQHNAFTGFNPGRTIYKKGTVVYEGGPELQCDIICDRDVAVTMRDGVKIYIDIFRPANSTGKVPAILAYGAYGKGTPRKPLAEMPAGDGNSGLAKFEAPDPGFYCRHGYAVINVDARGTNMSEGNIHYWGSVDAGDGYDLIEWVAAQDWCNGKISMGGRSWLGICQWYIAGAKPPHLAAIAPFGAHLYDMYRKDFAGGVATWSHNKMVTDDLMGKNLREHPWETFLKYPLMNEYWEDKIAKLENIKIPVYCAASYGGGDFEGARILMGPQTWIRVQTRPTNDDDLLRFYDRYLKGIENGWETTPRVRVAVMDPGGSSDQINRPEDSWPLPQTVYKPLFLDSAKGSLSAHPAAIKSTARYDAKEGQAAFLITFEEDTELTGYSKLVLWVEAEDADDMDIFVSVQKVDFLGNVHRATSGQQRVAVRALDPEKTLSYLPVHSYKKVEKLSKGQVVPVEVAIWPMGMLWHKGEQLLLTVAGDKLGNRTNRKSNNRGYHIIHTGPQYPSYLQVPVIPHKK
jgi:predicted acyl esterase